MTPRTYLFVPGDRPDRFAKALASGADRVVLDLEDAVAADAKDAARDAIRRWSVAATEGDRARVAVRVNAVPDPAFGADVALLRECRIGTAMLPKAERADDAAAVVRAVPGTRVLALVESARGIDACRDIAAAAGVDRLVFGTLDFALDLDLDLTVDHEPLAHAAGALTLSSRLAGLPSPVAGVTPQIDDEARLLADLAWARRHGFGAKLCVHPTQVGPVHAAMAPGADEVSWAERVVAADRASPGAARLEGRMIDRPVVLAAERTLRRAGR